MPIKSSDSFLTFLELPSESRHPGTGGSEVSPWDMCPCCLLGLMAHRTAEGGNGNGCSPIPLKTLQAQQEVNLRSVKRERGNEVGNDEGEAH